MTWDSEDERRPVIAITVGKGKLTPSYRVQLTFQNKVLKTG